MSDVFYPLGGIASSEIELLDRTIADEFESGATSSRRLWPDRTFKRRITVEHQNLSIVRFRVLEEFFAARSGRYDSFWFRDNVHRTGNHKVRLAKPFQIERSGKMTYNVKLTFDQVAPVKAFPTLRDIYNGALFVPDLWLDANRALWAHDYLALSESNKLYEADIYQSQTDSPTRLITWNSALNAYVALGDTGICQQYPEYYFNNDKYATDNTFTTGESGAKKVHSFFIVARRVSTSEKIIFGKSGAGANQGVGIQCNAAGSVSPWAGGSAEVWTGAMSNPSSGAWFTAAAVWPTGSDVASWYYNGALVGTKSVTRDMFDSKFHIGARLDGTTKFTGGVLQAIHFSAELDAAGVAALHNLFAYQVGLATV